MILLKVYNSEGLKEFNIDTGVNLLSFLREVGYDILSPCGGNGNCGKCVVDIKGEGRVISCIYSVTHDITITLPDKKTAAIITAQSEYCIKKSLKPGAYNKFSSSPFGVAIDIGTTSLVFYLVNLLTGTLVETRPVLNPQTKYGADVISRINYCSQEKNGLKLLQEEIINEVNSQLLHFIETMGISKNELVKISVSGNTTMLHLFLGVDPVPIALAPYVPKFTDEQLLSGKDLALTCHPEALIKVLPSISAYVGADIVAGIASLLKTDAKNYLFIDVGTNGEMALLTPEKIYSCATAAGPAFEGANISSGMAAVEGAISVYENKKIKSVGNAEPIGICGSGLIDIVAYLLNEKIIDQEGYMATKFEVTPSVSLTPADVREVQLAKSALYSGIKILMQEAGLEYNDISKLYLAGGFGNYINYKSAVRIGLLPREMEQKIIPVGNTSGAGALLALRSTDFDLNIQNVLSRSHYIELSTHDDFVMEFAMNMYF